MTVAEIQTLIYDNTGIKTSVKHLTGSMRGYLQFTPMLDRGRRSDFSDADLKTLRDKLKKDFFKTSTPPHIFMSHYSIEVPIWPLTNLEPIKYAVKKRRFKP